MPFENGNSVGVQFTPEYQPENKGRPKGSKNRSTIARKVLEMNAILPDFTFEKIKEVFPTIEQTMTAEQVATIVMIGNAIGKGDVNAYKAVMDSAYGSPKQELDIDTKATIIVTIE